MFQIAIRAEDDRCQVRLFLNIGTVPGSYDVLNRFELGGPSTIVKEVSLEESPSTIVKEVNLREVYIPLLKR
jgi:hypothetical protein